MEIKTHNNNNHSVYPDKIQDYMQALEQERLKILVFQRELPLSLQIVTEAIESCKQQLSGTIIRTDCDLQNRQLSECSEQTSSDAPVLEEFIPIIKRGEFRSDGDEEREFKKSKIDDETNVIDSKGQNGNSRYNDDDMIIKKSDWLRSVQLWNQSPDPLFKEDDSPTKLKAKKSGAFHPFKKDENVALVVENPVPPRSSSSTAINGGENKKEEKDGQRKARRCWSPELHKRFLRALQQLGGSHIATPKQIRELMKVDGLTNDEVKSHLQKYRLHTRRPIPSNQNTTASQFVVVTGGLWMPPEYTAAMSTTATMSNDVATPKGIYAPPIASLPQPFLETSACPKDNQHKTSEFNDRDSRSECGVRSSSPATSSSTHTTPVY